MSVHKPLVCTLCNAMQDRLDIHLTKHHNMIRLSADYTTAYQSMKSHTIKYINDIVNLKETDTLVRNKYEVPQSWSEANYSTIGESVSLSHLRLSSFYLNEINLNIYSFHILFQVTSPVR